LTISVRINTFFGFHRAASNIFLSGPPRQVDWIWQGNVARGATTLLTSQ
jgi:hypothetical protein